MVPLATLRVFGEEEVEALLCGQGEKWELDTLRESIKFDHGYAPTLNPNP